MKYKRTDILLVRAVSRPYCLERRGRVQGQSSIGLDAAGWAEARAAGRYLVANRPYVALYASDLQRSFETAGEIAAVLTLQLSQNRGFERLPLDVGRACFSQT